LPNAAEHAAGDVAQVLDVVDVRSDDREVQTHFFDQLGMLAERSLASCARF
jgi:hypothetical protein